jgi:hypothetical protein
MHQRLAARMEAPETECDELTGEKQIEKCEIETRSSLISGKQAKGHCAQCQRQDNGRNGP